MAPGAQALCMILAHFERCFAGHVSAIKVAAAAHSPTVPNPVQNLKKARTCQFGERAQAPVERA